MTFSVLYEGAVWGTFTSRLVGEHNLYNQVATVAALAREGLTPEQLAPGFESFRGIRRRQDVVGTVADIDVVDDFAHHPTAVQVTIEALRLRFGGRRLWICFEPRSNTSRRKIFQEPYAQAFDTADRVVVKATFDERIPADQRLDPYELAGDLRGRGLQALCLDHVDDIVALVAAEAMEGDVVACFSNGAFDGIHGKILAALRQRFGTDSGLIPGDGSGR
jgi:UDP-N-acetylmuramate: L-alanyl-gamma-D-glutamyl-meso-diaminopimelate ligase